MLTRALVSAGVSPSGARVLDVGCGTGFWTEYYAARGARYTGVDIAQVSVDRLAARYTAQRFLRADVSDGVPGGPYDLVNVFDVLYHVTDDARWQAALLHLAGAVVPGGLLLVTDASRRRRPAEAAHNLMRSLARYEQVLNARDSSASTSGPRTSCSTASWVRSAPSTGSRACCWPSIACCWRWVRGAAITRTNCSSCAARGRYPNRRL